MTWRDDVALRDLSSMIEKIEFVRPGSTPCMERDGVSDWLSRVPSGPEADLRYWLVHFDDETTTIMSDVSVDGIWWWEWNPTKERWVSSLEIYGR